MIIKGYKRVLYFDLMNKLKKYRLETEKTIPEIAVYLGLKTQQTVTNAFNVNFQTVKDKVLTKLMECLEFDGFIMWKNGERFYYINIKIK